MSVFEMEKAEIWVNDMRDALQIADEDRAWLALRAGLHALRDRLTVDEAAHLAAQMPMMIRGLFFEGWHPGGKRRRLRSRESFLEDIERELQHGQIDAEKVARATFHLLDEHVTAGMVTNVRHSLPRKLADLWAEPIALPN
ncbi:MAG TPA: DUF2267 domain-containing protein [Myxococcales bacterium]|nr:DUF2267 domain-containing protein [Myxococcales bacterium]